MSGSAFFHTSTACSMFTEIVERFGDDQMRAFRTWNRFEGNVRASR